MFHHPTNSAAKGRHSKCIIYGSPYTATYADLSLLLRSLSVMRQVCLRYWRWKCWIPTVPGFLAAKVWKYLRERERRNWTCIQLYLKPALCPTTHKNCSVTWVSEHVTPLFSLRPFGLNFLILETKITLINTYFQYNFFWYKITKLLSMVFFLFLTASSVW